MMNRHRSGEKECKNGKKKTLKKYLKNSSKRETCNERKKQTNLDREVAGAFNHATGEAGTRVSSHRLNIK